MDDAATRFAQDASRRRIAGPLRAAVSAAFEKRRANQASAIAEHNLAAALGNAGCWREALLHIEAAVTKGGAAPQTKLVLARALLEAGQLDQSERAYAEVLAAAPLYYEAHTELAQLRWMLTGDADAALSALNASIAAAPADTELKIVKIQLLAEAGQKESAHALALQTASDAPGKAKALVAASETALALGQWEPALNYAKGAAAITSAPFTSLTLAAACLAAGEPQDALDALRPIMLAAPYNQYAISLQAVAYRLLGDERYHALYDYSALVRPFTLSVPKGWSSLADYLADVGAALKETHTWRAHPLRQSIKHGTQSTSILDRQNPALQALPEALDPCIRQYIADVGAGDDVLRRRRSESYAIHGIWSIRMRAGGWHIDHVHTAGWLSSACYIDVPEGAGAGEGWLSFGRPGTPTRPACEAEYYVQPSPGQLVLFPSYMWHGTTPFTGAGVRMTFALDVVPD